MVEVIAVSGGKGREWESGERLMTVRGALSPASAPRPPAPRLSVIRMEASPLAELAGHVGLDRATLAAEIDALAPEIITGLAETGLLEALVNDQIDAFYDSPAFTEAAS